jgi:GAF domain-containing protein
MRVARSDPGWGCRPRHLAAPAYAPKPNLDRLTKLAAGLLDAPIALLTLVDGDRVVFVSTDGLGEWRRPLSEVPLASSICQYVVLTGRPLIVGDIAQHPSLARSPLVGQLGVRAYAGIPLVTSEQWTVGTLCVLDIARRDWTDDQLAQLAGLAAICVDEIVSAELGPTASPQLAASPSP